MSQTSQQKQPDSSWNQPGGWRRGL